MRLATPVRVPDPPTPLIATGTAVLPPTVHPTRGETGTRADAGTGEAGHTCQGAGSADPLTATGTAEPKLALV